MQNVEDAVREDQRARQRVEPGERVASERDLA